MIIDIIIPSLSRNKYSDKGDLTSWGNTTLLEWKISQAKKVIGINNIYVATPDKKIIALCKNIGVQTLTRTKKKSNMYLEISQKFSTECLLWIYCTSPFLSDKILNELVTNYKLNIKKFDTAITCLNEKEYFFFNNKSFNFSSKKLALERIKLDPLTKITNGACIVKNEILKKTGNIMGGKILFFEIDWLASLEIKESKDIDMYKSLFPYYFEK
jgi:CMP-N-acetylneuraminic acid synthetase